MKMQMLSRTKTGRVAACGMLLALALLFSYIESLLGLVFAYLPGIKLGLANIVVTFAYFYMSRWEAAAVSFCRVLIMGLLFGSAVSFMYSLGGAVLAYAGLVTAERFGEKISFIGTSVLCACLHNIGQIFVAACFFGAEILPYYLPYLLLGGALLGALTGALLNLISNKYKKVIGQ